MLFRRSALVLSLLLSTVPLFAADPPPAPEEHRRLQQWRYRAQPVPVPAGGIRWEMEGASWVLESGKLWLAEPSAEGKVTGLVFEGRGRFRMAVPDAVELTQLRRFAERPDLQAIDEPFTALVLRTAGDLPVQPADFPASSSFAVLGLARERHEHWLTSRFHDVDARVLAALRTPGDRYVRTEVRTDSLGWLTWDYDEDRIEEIRLERFNGPQRYAEVWLSLDKAADRSPDGRPGRREEPAIDIEHADIAVDLTKPGRLDDTFLGQFKVGLRLTGRTGGNTEGARAVQLYLLPGARVTAVSEGGKPLPFVRDEIGKRRGALDDRLSDESLLVLLEEPVVPGKPRQLDFEYEMELANYVRGRMWYPESEGDETFLGDLHTARIELTARKKYELRAMGKPEEVAAKEGFSRGAWTIDRPAKMVTFSLAEKLHEERVTVEGAPEVICFGSKVEVSRRGRFAEVARDVGESLAFFGRLFQSPLPAEEPMRVTSIAARHGQSFDGFLHLGEASFDLHGPGLAELFRGHEAAHQWWGHKVGAATYRDSWLEEAFAEYSAMLFVEAAAQDGPRLFQEILRSYHDELTGSIKSGFSKFSRMDVNLANRAHGNRIGPIGQGWRANTGEVPSAYSSQVYGRGTLVLHMLRRLLREATGKDDALVQVMGDFLRRHQGGFATTADFEAAVAARTPGQDWSWFFDQWVQGTAIPTYRWSYTPNDRGALLKVRQSDVPAGFRMPVPVRVELPDGVREITVVVDEPEESFELDLGKRPKSLELNPGYAVLARVKRE